MLPSKKLTVIYDKVVWAWICRDFKASGRRGATEKEIQRDAVAKTTFERFGITSYPHLTFVDPYKGTIIGRSARNVDSLIRTAQAAAAKVEKPDKGFDALKEKFDNGQALLKKGKREEAKKNLQELLEPADPWEFYIEAREILTGLGAYRKPKLPDARELKDPSADRRAEVLGFYTDHFPKTPFEQKAPALLTDPDGLVRVRCAKYVTVAAPAKVFTAHLGTMLHDPLDTVKWLAIGHFVKNPDPSQKPLLLKVQAEHKLRKIKSSNPNVFRMGIEKALKACEDIAPTSPEAKTEHFLKSRQALAEDPYRPLYHFSPPAFGLHDPGGLCWWRGKYHLFYLFTFNGIKWARGHAVSDDLVHWRDLPMLPMKIKGGTGQAWADKDRVILGYSTSKLATASDPLLLNWVEHPQKPVIGHGGDNCLWRAGNCYFLTQRKHSADPAWKKTWLRRKHPADGPAWFYSGKTSLEILRSKDLTQWEPLGDFLEDGYFSDPGEDCACSNVLSIGGGKHLVLFLSHKRGPQYYIGTFNQKQGRFTIKNHGRMNYGPPMRGSLHAPSGFVDPNGRCIGMWNIFECLAEQNSGGVKDGVISLPRRLSLKGPAKSTQMNPLCIEPIKELKALRFNPVKVKNVAIPANGEKILTGVQGRAMELEAVIDPRKAREVGLRVLRSPNGEEQTTISVSMHAYAWPLKSGKRELMIDVSQASLSTEIASRSPEIGPLYLEDGEPLRLRVFIDRSIVEVFANGRQCLTLRAYPTRKDSTGVSVFARGSEANIVSLDAYQMKSVWPDLKDQEGR